jgi:hypothetical protein
MSPVPTIAPRHVVIAGGGVGAVEALMALADRGERQLRLTMLADGDRFVLRPQLIGKLWGKPAIGVDLRLLADGFGATLARERLVAVDPVTNLATLASRAHIEFDELVVAVGASPRRAYTGAHTIGFGSLPPALAAGTAGDVAIVVPPGTGWTLAAYQLALHVAGSAAGRVRVHTPERLPLEAFGEDAARAVGELLVDHGVVVTGAADQPVGTDVGGLADTVLALPSLRGPALAGLPADSGGFHEVDDRLRLDGFAHVHVIGDATSGHLKQGGLAGQQADVAAADIAHRAGNPLAPEPYAPVLRAKLVAPDGTTLYLRRALDGTDAGRSSERPLWKPEGMLCAWRLTRWLDLHRTSLQGNPLEPVAR